MNTDKTLLTEKEDIYKTSLIVSFKNSSSNATTATRDEELVNSRD